MRKVSSFALGGGLDEVTQALAITPGRVIACLNHEAIDSGYGRVHGFERFDGRTGPTDYPFYLLLFVDGTAPILAGVTITGGTSGATGIVLTDAVLTGGAWDGTGFGTIAFRTLTGNFIAGENIKVGGVTIAVTSAPQETGVPGSGDAAELAWSEAIRDYARALIQKVPGSGVIRGVWEYEGNVYAFRNNAGGTACVMYKATASGWSAVTLGKTLAYTSGGTTEIVEGDTITGATSGATAIVKRVALQSGDWAAGTAQGYFTLSNVVGTFTAENLNVGAGLDLATISGAPTTITLPAGGRYFFVTHNFFGASKTRRMYGVNGVGAAFEFDGTVFHPIKTGAATDTPHRIAIFRNHLFLAFPNGSTQHSGPGDPNIWNAMLGAAEIAIGSDITDYIANMDSLAILGDNGIFVLTGYDATDWVLGTLTLEAGAIPYTAQRFGAGIYLDNRALRSIEASQSFGNFQMGSLSNGVQKTLRRKTANNVRPIASTIVRQKNHYRLFFDDGTGLSFYLGRKYPEPMYFDLGKVVHCVSSNESADNSERVFFGSSDGYVYQMDKGISFDGEPIEAFCQMPYAHLGTPQTLKRVFKVEVGIVADGGTQIGVAAEYDYSGIEQPMSSQVQSEAHGAGGLWGVSGWGEFYWSSPIEDMIEAYVDGQGRNVSTIVYSNSHLIAPYELRGLTIHYGERGQNR